MEELETSVLQGDSIPHVEFNPVFDEKYLNGLIEQATPKWRDVKDVDKWVRFVRGYDDTM